MTTTTGRLERYAPLSGLVAVGLLAAGVAVVETGAATPSEDTPATALAYFEAHGTTILVGSWLAALGLLALVCFYGVLRTALSETEGGGRLASVAFGGGLVSVGALAAAVLPVTSGAFTTMDADHGIGPETAQAMLHVGDAFFGFGFMAAAVPVAATAIAALRTGLLPRWFAFASFVLAVALLPPVVQWMAFVFLFPLWLAGCSVLLVRRRQVASARLSARAVAA